MSTGIELIAAERQRQIEVEGWDAKHDDDEHHNAELAFAAVSYAMVAADENHHRMNAEAWWPWELKWFKPKDRRSNLVRAGALIAAELDRLERDDERRQTPNGE